MDGKNPRYKKEMAAAVLAAYLFRIVINLKQPIKKTLNGR